MAFTEEAATAPAASVTPATTGQTQNAATTVPKPSGAPSKTEGGKAAEPEEDDDLYLKTRPEVVRCNWVQFKNRIRNPSGTGFDVATVELLATSETLGEDIENERVRRMDRNTKEKYWENYKRATMSRHNATRISELSFQRVRINSFIVLKYLARVSGTVGWPPRPHTFLIPFAFLIHNHDKMRAELGDLEERLRAGQGASEEAFVTAQSGEVGDYAKKQALEAVMVSDEACSQMRCYVNFVEVELIKNYRRFEEADCNNPAKVRFNDLWCLFRYGELLCRPNDVPFGAAISVLDRLRFTRRDLDYLQDTPEGPARGTSASAETHTIIRAKWVRIPCHEWDVEAVKDDDEDDLRWRLRETVVVGGFYLDHDGTKFAPVDTYVRIHYFHGERDIHKLPIFPVRFLKNKDNLLKQLRKRGTRFRELVSKAGSGREALTYEGWSRITTPMGEPIAMSRQSRGGMSPEHAMARTLTRFMGVNMDNSVQPEYISSDIILDFQEAFQSIPAWRPDFDTTKSDSETTPEIVYDCFHILCWADKSRNTKVKRVREAVVVDDYVADDLFNRLAQSDAFLEGQSGDGTDQPFTDDDLVLLPPRLMAYALRDRKFFHANIECVREKDWPSERDSPFESLKINSKHKSMILSIVNEHFEKQELAEDLRELGQNSELPDQDFIDGKGKGLVVLLHGDPGVGKTATAEAVALSRRRPLFLITCGDLGITPDSVEGGLKQIFRLANLWKCVLLLDEADIFLSQRERTDSSVMRNTMVSIFLRTLEYYPGILFLTTNRVGVMDEAVKSRVHVSLHYPALNLDQTLDVFDMNITRLRKIEKKRTEARRGKQGAGKDGCETAVREMTVQRGDILDFAEEHFKRDKNVRWNGRQIRNAFQIAASLAHFQQQDKVRCRGTGDLDDGADGVGNAADRDGGEDGGRSTPYIGREHFEQVAKATADFDKVRRRILRMSDSESAYQRAERAYDVYLGLEGYQRARQMPLSWLDEIRGMQRDQHQGRSDQNRAVNEQPFYEDDRDQDELDRLYEQDLYERDRHRGESEYGSGTSGRRRGGPSEYERGYGKDASISPPPRRRDRSSPSRGQGCNYRDERFRSRSRSGTRLPAREGMPKQRQSTMISGAAGLEAPDGLNSGGDGGRRSGGRGGGGGDSKRYSRRQSEKESRRERGDLDESVSEDTGRRHR